MKEAIFQKWLETSPDDVCSDISSRKLNQLNEKKECADSLLLMIPLAVWLSVDETNENENATQEKNE